MHRMRTRRVQLRGRGRRIANSRPHKAGRTKVVMATKPKPKAAAKKAPAKPKAKSKSKPAAAKSEAEPKEKQPESFQICAECVKMLDLVPKGSEAVEFSSKTKRVCNQCGMLKYTADRDLFKRS